MKNLIVPHDPAWISRFNDLKKMLLSILEDPEAEIQHVGSTAIPGLCAKPILDVDIVIKDKSLLSSFSDKLIRAGYIGKGDQGIPGLYAFRQSSPRTPCTDTSIVMQEHHLYICYSDSLALKNHILFMDLLLRMPKLVREYSDLKTALANEKGMTREKYTQRKTEFILSVLHSGGLPEKELNEIKIANQ